MTSYIPSVWVDIAGAGIPASALSELRIQQRLGLPAQCEISFAATWEAAGAIDIGQPLQASILTADEALFIGEITAVEYIYPVGKVPTLRVRGYDRLHQLRKCQHVRAYEGYSLERLLQALAGAQASLVGEDLSWPLLIQHQQNDLEFLAEQAAKAGRYPLARGAEIYLVPLSGLPGPVDSLPTPLVYGKNLFEARVEFNGMGDSDTLYVHGWEMAQMRTPSAWVAPCEEGEVIHLPADRLPDGRDDAGPALVNQCLEDEPHACALARAELERRRAGSMVLWARTAGSPALQPGAAVEVSHLRGGKGDGQYILTRATHIFDYAHGYTVELSSEPPPAPPHSRCDVITLGVVSSVDDPQQMGRVRARLPGYEFHNVIETGWMPVVCPGAGANKGLVTLPDPGDRVLVVLSREDPARGIVLGGLYAPEKPPDDGIQHSRANRYTWTTRAGQTIRLDQEGHLVLIENGSGAGIELRGSEVIIRGARIDFRQS